jgi:hypothetical protein
VKTILLSPLIAVLSYNLDEYELSQISYMYLDRCLIKYLDRDYWDEGEEDRAKEIVEGTKKAMQFLIEYGTLSNPKKGYQMSNVVSMREQALDPAVIESIVMKGDLVRLTPAQKVAYYNYSASRQG